MKIAIVTGGTRGLGRALSIRLLGDGFGVIAVYASNDAAAESLAREAAERNQALEVLKLDITDRLATQGLSGHPSVLAADELVLVNNACAAFEPAHFHRTTMHDFQAGLRVAVEGTVACTQAVLRKLVANRGIIINVLSDAVTDVPKGFSAYVTSKYALLGLSKSLRAELAPQGVRVITVAPGFMDTDLTGAWDERLRTAFASGRRTTTAQTADAIVAILKAPSDRDSDVYPV